MESSSNSDIGCARESVLVTPYMLLKSHLQPLNIDLPPSFNSDDSFTVSMKEGCESPLSSWDSEPEIDIPSEINCHGMPGEEQSQFAVVENTDDSLLWEMDNRSYDELLKKCIKNEEELRLTNLKLQLSEKEIIKLKVQVENSEGQLDNVREKLKLKEDELHKQKELSEKEIFKLNTCIETSENQLVCVHEELKMKKEELQKQTAELDTHIPELVYKITNLVKQLEAAHAKIKISKNENAILRKELGSKSSETYQLQGQLKVAQENMAKSELELVSGRKQIQMLGDLVIKYETNKTNHKQDSKILNSKMLYVHELNPNWKCLNLEEENETGVLVMSDTLLRSMAVKALKTRSREIFCAIMELIDEIGVKNDDIELLLTHVGASRSEAIQAIKTRNRDIVGAIMKLTDEAGMDANDIELVMTQEGVSRRKAVKALKTHNGDIVAAILELADEASLEANDIKLVMTQAGVSKSEAVKALKTHNGEILGAIMELIDETGVEASDIELVMTQAGVSRYQAVMALKTYNGNIDVAIMEVTDEIGVEDDDIMVVMTQTGVSRSMAVKALKTLNGSYDFAL